MPFTLAHPAIVLPLNRSKGRFSLTALVSGSIVPDFEFFFQMKEVENIGHHWYGILLFDLPVAWAFCFLYHGLLRNAFLANLPAYFRNRFTGLSNFNWARFATANRLKITVSILIGIFTHIIWDEFTHADGVFLPVIPALSNAVKLGSTSLPVYYLLQILFSYHPWMNRLFHSAPLMLTDWAMIVAASAAVFLIVGLEKWMRLRLAPAPAQQAAGKRG